MALLMNVLWVVFGGLAAAVSWMIAGLIMIISIVGIPWARAAMTIGLFMLWPFGRTVVERSVLYGREDIGTGPLGTVGNIIWFVFAGWWLALVHLFWGVVLCLTIIGIPFGIQHFKFAGHAIAPIGKEVVDSDLAELALRRRHRA
jgi:uncharacterized membrane protein YccF (DUF307 family)